MAKMSMNNVSDIEKRSAIINPMSLFGASAMGFPDKVSTVRSVMMTRMTSQRVVLTNPEPARLFTGAENEYGERSSWNVRLKDDYELMKVFVKFKDYEHSPTCYILKNIHTGKYKCEVVYPAVNLTEKYGFQIKNHMKKYHEGDVLKKGTSIAQTSSYVDDNYCAGVNIRSCYTILPELTEDALVISDYAAEMLAYDMVDIVKCDIKKDSFLLNKYGKNGEYKPFPDVGEMIENDIVCSIRENSFVSSFSEASMPHITDKNAYSKGIVVDIDIQSNVENEENEQVNKYLHQIRDWYSDIYSYISQIIKDPTQDDTTLLDIYHKADKWLNDSTWVTKEKIINTNIIFTVLQHKAIHVGQKVVGRYGNKSVISEIRPRELMPRTDDGRPIDMIMNGLSLLNRIVCFATYENTITFQTERMYEYLKTIKKNMSRDDLVDFAADFVGMYNPNEGREIKRLYKLHPDEVYNDIVDNGFYIQIEPMNEIPARDSILEVYDKFPDIMKRYKIYTKLAHRWVPVDGMHAVGYQYTWVLKQEPSKAMSVVATGRTTYYDIPVKTRQYKNNLRRYSDNPIKFGEYDTYNFLAGVGPIDFAKITTYYRGSQYADHSMLMAQLNDMELDLTKFNKFPQLSNMKNVLKLNGVQLKESPFTFNSIGLLDKKYTVYMNNVTVDISIPDLSYVLQIHSYYLKYEQYLGGAVDLVDFFNHIRETDLFYERDEEYIQYIFDLFAELLPVLQQIKQYT